MEDLTKRLRSYCSSTAISGDLCGVLHKAANRIDFLEGQAACLAKRVERLEREKLEEIDKAAEQEEVDKRAEELAYRMSYSGSKSCANCRHYYKLNDTEDLCRRDPPQLVEKGGVFYGRFPYTSPNNLCGEWKKK